LASDEPPASPDEPNFSPLEIEQLEKVLPSLNSRSSYIQAPSVPFD